MDEEQANRVKQLERMLGRKQLEIEILKNVLGVSCGMAHSQARELGRQGYTATLVSHTLKISRSSLYCRKRPQRDRVDGRHDEQMVVACGEITSYGHRRIAWWMQRENNAQRWRYLPYSLNMPVASENSTGARLRDAPYMARSIVATANSAGRVGIT